MARAGEDGGGGGDAGVDDERWLAIAEDAWRRARVETNPFRRHALIEQTAGALVRGTARGIRGFCRGKARNETEADDLAQQTYLTLWRTLPRFEGRSSLKTFVHGIAHNICRDAIRARVRAGAHTVQSVGIEDLLWLELAPELGPPPDEALLKREASAALRLALRTLDERDTWLLWARVVDQESYADMLPAYQRRFGTQIATVEGLRTALFHAKRRLIAALERGDA